MDALVTDVQLPAAVAGIRGLGRARLDVLAVAPRRGSAGLWSRWAARRAIAPPPGSDPIGFVAALARLAAEHGPLVIYPGSENAIEAAIDHWDELSVAAILPYPGPGPLSTIRDKRRLPELAAAAGLQAPRTLAIATASELAGERLHGRCVVKPARPVGERRGAHVIDSEQELAALVAAGRLPAAEPLVLQEPVVGSLTSLELVLAPDGAVAECFQQAAARTSPAPAGLISSSLSVATDPRLVERAASMLASVGHWGLAQLDLVVSEHDAFVIDVNPRFYSCLPLSLACGVNIPAAWHAVATGRTARPSSNYPVGVRYRWLEGDLVEAIRGDSRRLLTRPSPRTAGAIWANDDPVSGFALGAAALARRLRRLRRYDVTRATR